MRSFLSIHTYDYYLSLWLRWAKVYYLLLWLREAEVSRSEILLLSEESIVSWLVLQISYWTSYWLLWDPSSVRLIYCILPSEITLNGEVGCSPLVRIRLEILMQSGGRCFELDRALEMPVFHPKEILDFPFFVSSYARCRLLDEIIPQAWGWLHVLMSEMLCYTKGEGKRKKKVKCYICISPQWWGWLRFLPVMKLVYELFPSVRLMIAPECRARRLNSYKFRFLFAGESVSCRFTLCWWVRSYQWMGEKHS